MNDSVERQDNLNMLIQEVFEPEVSNADKQLFRDSIEEIRVPGDQGGNLVKQIDIILSQQGDKVLEAHTIKLPNLRFNLAKFLLASATEAAAVVGTLEHPISLALSVIKFLQTIQGLAKKEIEPKDAQVLLAILKLSREENSVKVDQLDTVIQSYGITETERPIILERLEQLGCISITMDEIQLNERIVVRSET